MNLSNKKLSQFLCSKIPQEAKFIEKIKIGYRPYICPFVDLLKIIPQNVSVFDIGCGSGMLLSLVSEFRNPKSVGGIEISQELIDNASDILKKNEQSRFFLEVYDGKSIPYNIGEYEYILMVDVIHHIPQSSQMNILSQVYEKMSPGSKLIIKDIDASNKLLCKFNKMHDLLLSGNIGNELRSDFVMNKVVELGFRIKKFNKKNMLFYPHYTIICEK